MDYSHLPTSKHRISEMAKPDLSSHPAVKLEKDAVIDLGLLQHEHDATGDSVVHHASIGADQGRISSRVDSRFSPQPKIDPDHELQKGRGGVVSEDGGPFGDETTSEVEESDEDDTRSIRHDEHYGTRDDQTIIAEPLNGSHQIDTPHEALPELTANTIPEASDQIPEALNELLEQWYAKHGRIPPPCATTTKLSNLYKSTGGRVTEWYHKSGERVQIHLHALENIKYKTGYTYRVIVARGPTQGPYLIGYAGVTSSGATYKIWYGPNGGDKGGFERTASILKGNNGMKSPPLNHPGWDTNKVVKGKRKPSKKKAKWANQFVPDTTPQFRGSRFQRRAQRRKLDSERDLGDAEALLASFSASVDPAKAARTSLPNRPPERVVIPEPSSSKVVLRGNLEEHIQNNAVFLFYPNNHSAQLQPRIRLFGACNTSQKLFAQAIAGDVFERASMARVLSVRIGGGKEARAVVEGDDQDFEELVAAIKGAGCWKQVEGGHAGSCTVEVRAKF